MINKQRNSEYFLAEAFACCYCECCNVQMVLTLGCEFLIYTHLLKQCLLQSCQIRQHRVMLGIGGHSAVTQWKKTNIVVHISGAHDTHAQSFCVSSKLPALKSALTKQTKACALCNFVYGAKITQCPIKANLAAYHISSVIWSWEWGLSDSFIKHCTSNCIIVLDDASSRPSRFMHTMQSMTDTWKSVAIISDINTNLEWGRVDDD